MTNEEQYLATFRSIDFDSIAEHPNILIAARFWDEERYRAAKVCYKFMRLIDDMIDDHKAANKKINGKERKEFADNVNKWLNVLLDKRSDSPMQEELQDTIRRFRIPSWPMEAFAKSMLYDVFNTGFQSMQTFIEYSQGASVAPASIFVHLAGLRENNGSYDEPPYDVRKTATPCAIFSYLVHIMRDFRKDQLNNLNYFAFDIMARNGLTHTKLNNIAHGAPITSGFRNMMNEYYTLADEYRLETVMAMKEIFPLITPQYRLSFEIIFELYLMVFERIDIAHGTFSTEELNPTPAEIKDRVLKVIMRQ